jgi:hypothetical protein
MHEHVSKELIELKISRKEEVKTKDVVEIYRSSSHETNSLKQPHQDKRNHVDKEKVLRYGGNTHHLS